MFGLGYAELFLLMGTVLVLTLVWQGWRARWVSVSREWVTDLDIDDVEDVLRRSFAAVPGTTWRSQPDGSWVHTVRRVPFWAVLLGVFTLPLGLLLFLVKETADLHVRLFRDEQGCRVLVVGRTPERTLNALDSWLTRMAKREAV
ncbi:MAG: hypothetical protein ABIR39_24180 [Nocardioides sp.]|uniref:hypothetical protein n=1 Tax=Nocardioides sp. TaxID=35761 RepID=UPI0032638AF5